MLIIHGKQITSEYEASMNRAFGPSYKREDKLDSLLESIIEDQHIYRFPSMRAFKSFIIEKMRGTKGTLLLTNINPTYNQAYEIEMTGNRTRDFAAANTMIGVQKTPDDYTWHHAEGIRQIGTSYYCKMYLILTTYHRAFPHFGGVGEYQILTGKKYY